MNINPNALALWVFCVAIGALISGSTGALAGLAVGTGISVLAGFLPSR